MESKPYSIHEIRQRLHAAVDNIQGDGSNILLYSENGSPKMVGFCDDMQECCNTLLAALASCIDDLDDEDKAATRNVAHLVLNGVKPEGGDKNGSN